MLKHLLKQIYEKNNSGQYSNKKRIIETISDYRYHHTIVGWAEAN